MRLSYLLLSLTLFIVYFPAITEGDNLNSGIRTVKCGEPRGINFLVGPDPFFKFKRHKIQTEKDGYTGVNPVFIILDTQPDEVLVTFGPANPTKKENTGKTETTRAMIIKNHNGVITAIEAPDQSSVWIYSLYPENGMAYMSRHGRFLTGAARASTFYAPCEFNNF